MFTHLNYYNTLFRAYGHTTKIDRKFCVYANNAFLTVNNIKSLSGIYLEPTINLEADIIVTPYFEDHNPQNKIYYIPPVPMLDQYIKNIGGFTKFINQQFEKIFLLQSYNNLFIQKGSDFEEVNNLIGLDSYQKYVVTSENLDDSDALRYYPNFQIRSRYFSLSPTIELFSIANEDFVSEMDIANSIITSLQNPYNQIYIKMDNFKDSKIYKELNQYSDINHMESNLYKITPNEMFNSLIKIDFNIFDTYIKKVLNNEIFGYQTFEDLINALQNGEL